MVVVCQVRLVSLAFKLAAGIRGGYFPCVTGTQIVAEICFGLCFENNCLGFNPCYEFPTLLSLFAIPRLVAWVCCIDVALVFRLTVCQGFYACLDPYLDRASVALVTS